MCLACGINAILETSLVGERDLVPLDLHECSLEPREARPVPLAHSVIDRQGFLIGHEGLGAGIGFGRWMRLDGGLDENAYRLGR